MGNRKGKSLLQAQQTFTDYDIETLKGIITEPEEVVICKRAFILLLVVAILFRYTTSTFNSNFDVYKC